MSDSKTVMDMIKENDVEFVDFRFTDPRGKWQHTAQHVSTVDEEMLTEGIMFDGSSIAGWKPINESDMNLNPDLSTAEIGRASCRERVCQSVEISVGAVPFKKQ